MATYDDWMSVGHILPVIDATLHQLGHKAHVVIVDDSSRHFEGKEQIRPENFKAIEAIDEIQLGSNQGNQRALAVGLGYIARNLMFDALVVMDSDNEDKPEDLPALLKAYLDHQGAKIVFAERTKRSESSVFKFFYVLYKWLFKFLTGHSISMGNFCIIPWHSIRRIAHLAELWNHFPVSVMRSGLSFAKIPTTRGIRLFGKGKMNLVRLIIHAFSGFSIHADVIAVRIMLLATGLVGVFLLLTMAGVIIHFTNDIFVPGWTSQFLFQFLLLATMVMCTAVVVLISVLSMRMQPPLVPFHDYSKFVFEIVRQECGREGLAPYKIEAS
ncbi:MAG: glycosyltransferase [Alphaproteobacteria bacterium]|nr:glycosyltransferase [Alphaproteobacteria bacterium]